MPKFKSENYNNTTKIIKDFKTEHKEEEANADALQRKEHHKSLGTDVNSLDEEEKIVKLEGENHHSRKRKRTKILQLKKEINEEEIEESSMGKREVLKAVRDAAKSSGKLLGAHVSAQGGPHNAIKNAIDIGCQAFALFVRNQRRWESKPMSSDTIDRWKEAIEATQFPMERILPHASYLINAGSHDPKKLEMSRNAMLDECQRCEMLGIGLYNFHPGSTTGVGTKGECLARIADSINYVHERTQFITLVIETMCGSGNTVGDKFEHFRTIIDKVRDKNRVGVCIDTCHTFASGYDLKTRQGYEKSMEEFDHKVGFKYLKAFHLNDSGGDLSSKVDRHRNIGEGRMGEAAFELLMSDSRFDGIPMILETPEGKYTEEMLKLYQLEGKKQKAKGK